MGFQAAADTCTASSAVADYGGSCWDFGRDHSYRILMLAGESVTVTFDNGSQCSQATSWDPVLKIYASPGCGDKSQCTEKHACQLTGSGAYTKEFTAPHDGWYFVIVDGRTSAFDDSGKYTLAVKLTCSTAGCGC